MIIFILFLLGFVWLVFFNIYKLLLYVLLVFDSLLSINVIVCFLSIFIFEVFVYSGFNRVVIWFCVLLIFCIFLVVLLVVFIVYLISVCMVLLVVRVWFLWCIILFKRFINCFVICDRDLDSILFCFSFSFIGVFSKWNVFWMMLWIWVMIFLIIFLLVFIMDV